MAAYPDAWSQLQQRIVAAPMLVYAGIRGADRFEFPLRSDEYLASGADSNRLPRRRRSIVFGRVCGFPKFGFPLISVCEIREYILLSMHVKYSVF